MDKNKIPVIPDLNPVNFSKFFTKKSGEKATAEILPQKNKIAKNSRTVLASRRKFETALAIMITDKIGVRI